MHVLVTGSSGLIGSEAVTFFDDLDFDVTGLDNNMRADFFGPRGDTRANRDRLLAMCKRFQHVELDVRDRAAVDMLFRTHEFNLVVHAAAQPSHDLAARRPLDDFDVNAGGTLNILEATRKWCSEAVLVFMSTNKVYGDGPNTIPLKELDTRWAYDDPAYVHGIGEDFPIDRCTHSIFGASKVAADVMTQEYGRYYGLKTGVFRGGCLTGPQHAGVELHGFLQYLVSVARHEGEYTIFGYKGKQVRDQLHSADVVEAIWAFAQDPRPGEVYNLGGGADNAASLLECIELVAEATGTRPKVTYSEKHRTGDHICYYSDLRKLQTHYPQWRPQRSLKRIIEEIVEFQSGRAAA